MFAKISGSTVLEWPIPNIVSRFPNISFPANLTDANLPEGYVYVGITSPPDIAPGKKVVPGMPVKQGSTWVQSWDVVDMSAIELQELSDSQASFTRKKRDSLLQQSDVLVLKLYEQALPVPADVVQYRQALRDIPLQEDFPHTVVWPIQPQ